NFLYVSLHLLKNLEEEVRRTFASLNLPFRDVVTPRQFYGIEKDTFAANLAHVVVWIGYLQWRYKHEGTLQPVLSTRDLRLPHIETTLTTEKDRSYEPVRILNADAIMRYDADGSPYEPEWPTAYVIVGNPPFLGGNRIRAELKDRYVDDLFRLYEGRV